MKIEEVLQALADAIVSEECTSFGAQQVIIGAIKKKYGLGEVHIVRHKSRTRRPYWSCTTDSAYEWQEPSIQLLEAFLGAFKAGDQTIAFLDTNRDYDNLEDLRKDILVLRLANVQ